ncbi:MAG: hypothetical protein ACJAUV_000349 [Flavobacteriales bacterium]|jgi:hypothetical protein
MKKIILSLFFISVNFLSFAQIKTINPLDTKIIAESKVHFSHYSGIIEATVLSTNLENIDGEFINRIQLKIHRIYKGDFSEEIIVVNMTPKSKLILEKTGINQAEMEVSHGDGIMLNPIKDLTGFFFLTKGHFSSSNSWFVRRWNAYPNKERYDFFFKQLGDIVNHPQWYNRGSFYKFSFYAEIGGFESLIELYNYIENIFGGPSTTFSNAEIEFYTSPNMRVLPSSIPRNTQLDNENRAKGLLKQKESEEKLKELEELNKARLKKMLKIKKQLKTLIKMQHMKQPHGVAHDQIIYYGRHQFLSELNIRFNKYAYILFTSYKSVLLSLRFRTLPFALSSLNKSRSTSAIKIISELGVASAFTPLVGKEKSHGVNTID